MFLLFIKCNNEQTGKGWQSLLRTVKRQEFFFTCINSYTLDIFGEKYR